MAYKKKKSKTKRSIGPAGASIVSKDGKRIKPSSAKPRKDGALFPGQSKGYPKTLDIRYAKDLAMQKKMKMKKTIKKVSSRL